MDTKCRAWLMVAPCLFRSISLIRTVLSKKKQEVILDKILGRYERCNDTYHTKCSFKGTTDGYREIKLTQHMGEMPCKKLEIVCYTLFLKACLLWTSRKPLSVSLSLSAFKSASTICLPFALQTYDFFLLSLEEMVQDPDWKTNIDKHPYKRSHSKALDCVSTEMVWARNVSG